MATIQGLTAPRMLEIEAAAIVAGVVDENMHLILTKHDGTTIDAGKVQGDGVPMGGTEGQIIIKTVDGSIWADNFATNVEQVIKNSTGATLTKGTAVYVSGASGDNVLVSKAQANSEGTSSKTLGLLHNDVANGATGQVITEGTLYGFDTSSATVGDPVWLSPTTAGGLVYGLANKPTVPNHMVYLGVVIRSHAVNGAIYVKVQNGYELDELHDVKITNPQPKQVIKRDPTNQFWLNEAASGGVTVSETLPVDPSVGDGWFYSKDGTLFFRYFDGTNYAYVQADVPMSPTIEQRYYSPNYVINGAFDIWQRGTTISSAGGGYVVDRWRQYTDTGSGTNTRQPTFMTGVTQYCHRFTSTSASTNYSLFQYIETSNAINLAGKTITLSAYLRASTTLNMKLEVSYSTTVDAGWGVGTFTVVDTKTVSVSTTGSRHSLTVSIPSNATSLSVGISCPTNLTNGQWVEETGIQIEEGLTASQFRRHAGSIQQELSACQRYYYRISGEWAHALSFVRGTGTTTGDAIIPYKQTMRKTPDFLESSGLEIVVPGVNSYFATAAYGLYVTGKDTALVSITSSNMTNGGVFILRFNTTGYIAWSAEL